MVVGLLAVARAGASVLFTRGTEARFAGDSLILPQGIERWVLAGASLGLGYTAPAGAAAAGRAGRHFHNVYIEPSAYEHYVRTGRFRDGTMLALTLYPAEEGAAPRAQGLYEGDRLAVEVALKDSRRYPGAWAYFGFGAGVPESRAVPFPRGACQRCHAAHAADDNVFVQFYPALRGVPARPRPAR